MTKEMKYVMYAVLVVVGGLIGWFVGEKFFEGKKEIGAAVGAAIGAIISFVMYNQSEGFEDLTMTY